MCYSKGCHIFTFLSVNNFMTKNEMKERLYVLLSFSCECDAVRGFEFVTLVNSFRLVSVSWCDAPTCLCPALLIYMYALQWCEYMCHILHGNTNGICNCTAPLRQFSLYCIHGHSIKLHNHPSPTMICCRRDYVCLWTNGKNEYTHARIQRVYSPFHFIYTLRVAYLAIAIALYCGTNPDFHPNKLDRLRWVPYSGYLSLANARAYSISLGLPHRIFHANNRLRKMKPKENFS